MTINPIIKNALTGKVSVDDLSPRQREVLRFIGFGLNDHEIAKELLMASKTVGVHAENMKKRVGLSTRSELIIFAACWLIKTGDLEV